MTMKEDNSFDNYAVAVVKNSSIVGHLTREIPQISWFFLQKRQSKITCVATAGRERSTIRGKGLVVPCVYILEGKTKHLEKLISLIRTIELEHYLLTTYFDSTLSTLARLTFGCARAMSDSIYFYILLHLFLNLPYMRLWGGGGGGVS